MADYPTDLLEIAAEYEQELAGLLDGMATLNLQHRLSREGAIQAADRVRELGERVRSLTPPDRFAEVHETYLKAISEYDQAMGELIRALEEHDDTRPTIKPEGIEPHLRAGAELAREVTRQLGELRST